mgnify:FL=1
METETNVFHQRIIVKLVSMTAQVKNVCQQLQVALQASSTMAQELHAFQILLIALIHLMMDQGKSVSPALKIAF